jgi:Protein of unknown function (DUF3617)
MHAWPSALPILALIALGLPMFAMAEQQFPQRKAGLWEVTTEMAGAAGRTMKSRHCVDAKTDEQAQRQAMDAAGDARCQQRAVKRGAGVFEAEYTCENKRGKSEGKMKWSGDFNSRYTMSNQVRFDPPLHGRSEASMTLQGQWLGACPAGMKPGEVRIDGMNLGAGQRGDRAGRQGQAPSPEQMQKIQEMMEQMKQGRGNK